MHSDKSPSEPPANASRPLEVFRLKPGKSAVIRCLSDQIDGLNTHWQRDRSHYCPGETACPVARHREDVTWKGYIAAEVFEQALSLWVPIVLELTEYLERDMRVVYCRGQIWELFKRVQSQRMKHPPLEGKLLEERNPASFPPAFDIISVLEAFYHFPGLRLGVVNPLAPRTLLAPSAGDPPAKFAPQGRSSTAEERQHVHDRIQEQKAKLGKAMNGTA